MKFNSKHIRNNKIFQTPLLIAVICCGMMTEGCLEDIRPEREVRDRGTFGTELYNIVYDNSVYSAEHSSPEFLSAFAAQRDKFIDAVDKTAPAHELEEINQVFVNIVPLYENLLYPAALRKTAVIMNDFRNSPEAIEGLAYIWGGPRLLAHPEDANILGLTFAYDDLMGITEELLQLILKHTTGDHNATNQLFKELSLVMADLEYNDDPNRFVRRAVDMLLKPDIRFAPDISYTPQIAAALDAGGLPRLLPSAQTWLASATQDNQGFYQFTDGSRVAPFQMDGMPAGFELVNGQLQYQQQPVFETYDLQQTPLAYLVREGDALFLDNTADEALRAFQTLLGTPQSFMDEDGTFTGYSRDSGVAQLLAALVTTLDHDSVGPNFEAIVQLIRNNEDVIARLIHDLDTIIDIWDETPSKFSADNNLIDRLVPELLQIAQTPGLLEDLFMALDDPRTARIAPYLAELAELKKPFIAYDKNSQYEACFQTCDTQYEVGTFERMDCIRACPIEEILGTTHMAHDLPESEENRSLFQRVTNLMWETSETPYEVHAEHLTFGESNFTAVAQAIGTLISFDNLAEAYLKTITGDLHLVDHLSPTFMDLSTLFQDDGTTVAGFLTMLCDNLFDLKLSIHPTTAEVTRLFNMPIISSQSDSYRFDLNVATCRSGHPCLNVNADVLFAIEASGLIDALYPLIKVFNQHDRTDILARVIAILFEYYPTGNYEYTDAEGKPLELQPSDFRSLEPVLIRALRETDIVADVGALGDALLNVKLTDGTLLTARFEDFVEYLLQPDKNLRKIDGAEYTKDPQGNFIAPLSPAYLYIDAIRDINDVLDAHPETQEQLEHALTGIANVTIKTQKQPDGQIHFEKPAGIQIIASAVELMHTVFVEKTADGTRHEWIHNEAVPDVVDLLSGRLIYAFFQLFNDLDADPEGLEDFRRLILHLMESGKDVPTHLTGTAYILMDWMLEQKSLDAFAHVFSAPLAPDYTWTTIGFTELSYMTTMLVTVDAFNECDPGQSFMRLFYRFFETDTQNKSNAQRIFEIGGSLFRAEPGSSKPRQPADYKAFIDFVHDLFTDDDRGVERIFGVIDFTIWGNDRRPADWKPEDASWQIKFD